MTCPNHDETQICPDCTYRPRRADKTEALCRVVADWLAQGHHVTVVGTKTGSSRSLSPVEQHKADLEMIIAACVEMKNAHARYDTVSNRAAVTSYDRIENLASRLLDRIGGVR